MRFLGKKFMMATLVATAIVGVPAAVLGAGHGTPDGQTPATERVCDDANLQRSAFGICIAFCEAGDCDTHPARPSCKQLRKDWKKFTGNDRFPCEVAAPPPWWIGG